MSNSDREYPFDQTISQPSQRRNDEPMMQPDIQSAPVRQPSPAPLTDVERVVSGHCDHMDSPHTKDECQASWHRNWRPYTTLPSADRESQAASYCTSQATGHHRCATRPVLQGAVADDPGKRAGPAETGRVPIGHRGDAEDVRRHGHLNLNQSGDPECVAKPAPAKTPEPTKGTK